MKVKLGKGYKLPLPNSRLYRILIGISLILLGLLGFLPVLGFWMIPLGVIVLSVDLPMARRLRRRVESWWGRRKGAGDGSAARRRDSGEGSGSSQNPHG